MNLLTGFRHYIKNENLFQPKDNLVLAVSGGVDSVVLCELCKQADYDFTIAHCNFQLRAEESERDEEFVMNLGRKYKVEVLVKKFDTEKYANDNKLGMQEAARDLRYKWFYQLIENQKSRNPKPETRNWLLTAHHANDNIETLLMNFFKGTGISGLHGILAKPSARSYIVHPLLFALKEDIRQFAKDNNLLFVEDSSNSSDKYTRNYLRNQLIPSIKKVYPQVEENLKANLERFRDIELLYQQAVEIHKKKLLEQKGNEAHIPVLKLKKTTPLHAIIYEIIKEFGFSSQQVNEVKDLLDSESGKYIKSASHRIIKNRNWLIIAPRQTDGPAIILIEGIGNLEFGIGNLVLESLSNSQHIIPDSPNIAIMDAAEIKFPLLLRPWRQGDYFYPLGMKKKKKLSRFFIDLKLSKTDKEKVWVLEMNKKIIWVIGLRIDDRFKITVNTKEILKISLKAREIVLNLRHKST